MTMDVQRRISSTADGTARVVDQQLKLVRVLDQRLDAAGDRLRVVSLPAASRIVKYAEISRAFSSLPSTSAFSKDESMSSPVRPRGVS